MYVLHIIAYTYVWITHMYASCVLLEVVDEEVVLLHAQLLEGHTLDGDVDRTIVVGEETEGRTVVGHRLAVHLLFLVVYKACRT